MVAEWYPREGHLPAVQIARDGYRGHRHLAGGEVVTRVGGNHRLGGQFDATVEVRRLLDILLITRSTIVYVLGTITDAIVETEVPRYREVVVLARHPLSAHSGVERAVGVGPRVEVLGREGGDIVTCYLALILA